MHEAGKFIKKFIYIKKFIKNRGLFRFPELGSHNWQASGRVLHSFNSWCGRWKGRQTCREREGATLRDT
jgi:hypothetical protein